MKEQMLRRVQRLPGSVDQVFSFFQMPENLALITPAWLDFHLLTPTPVVMRQGTVIEYRIRWLSVPIRWTTLITVYEPPFRFVDEQIRGPYALWSHTHTFRDAGGWTEMTDEVRYRLPLGPAGRLAHRFVVRHQLEEIFDHRSRVIGQVFGMDAHAQEKMRMDRGPAGPDRRAR